jgi:hypothetical protein
MHDTRHGDVTREAISRLQLVDEAHEWRVKLLRHGDALMDAAIDVRLFPGARAGEDLICWLIRPTTPRFEVK